MQLEIPANPNFDQIPLLASKLNPTEMHQIERAAYQNISSMNTAQLAFIVALVAFDEARFETTLRLLNSYLNSRGTERLNELFVLETYLASSVLKKFESQKAYAAFYSVFDKFYKANISCSVYQKKDSADGVLFFVHAPVFLAHTNPLFEILKTRSFSGRVAIATLSSNEKFSKTCASLNVDHIVLGGDTLSAKINELEYLSADYAHIVWQCLPALLSYFSARVKNVCWWSFKFNPPITGLEHCITSLPENVDKKEINGNVWVNFTPQFKLKNRTRSKGPWQERRGRIAAFCREELIDEEKYWSFLSKLLKANKSFSFEYCGRREIHSKWTNRFSINPNQVRFLGWLKNPEINIREVAVLLDTYGLRHGLMAYEAAVVGVPIAIPTLSESFGGIQGVYERLGIDAKEFLSPAFGSFGSEEEGVAMLSKLALEEHYNNALGDKQQCLFKQLPFKGFDALTEILQGSEG